MSVDELRQLWINRFRDMHAVKLNVSEWTIYQVLAKGEKLTAHQVSLRTGIKAHWVRPCLQSLFDKGYITYEPGKPKLWWVES